MSSLIALVASGLPLATALLNDHPECILHLQVVCDHLLQAVHRDPRSVIRDCGDGSIAEETRS